MNDLKEPIEESIDLTLGLIRKIETSLQENEDLRNRSMRSTLIFHGVPKSEKNDSWEKVSQILVGLLAVKLNLD